jgi:hypothetical protein
MHPYPYPYQTPYSAQACIYIYIYMYYKIFFGFMSRVGQDCIYTPYMTVYLVISLPKIPYVHRIYMVLANPIHVPRNDKRTLTQSRPTHMPYGPDRPTLHTVLMHPHTQTIAWPRTQITRGPSFRAASVSGVPAPAPASPPSTAPTGKV